MILPWPRTSSPPEPRTRTAGQTTFARTGDEAVVYDLSVEDQATIRVPPGSAWTSGPHWHASHTEFLQVLRGRAEVYILLDEDDESSGRRTSAKKAKNARKRPINSMMNGTTGGGEGYGTMIGRHDDEEVVGEDEEDDDDDDNEASEDDPNTTLAAGPLDGVIVVPRGAIHEWRRSRTEGLDEELVVREWTDPKDGAKEGFFRNLNGVILDAVREGKVEEDERGMGEGEEQRLLGGRGVGNGDDDDNGRRGARPGDEEEAGVLAAGTAKKRVSTWRRRTLELDLMNLFWRMDNFPVVLNLPRRAGGGGGGGLLGWWKSPPRWAHEVATRSTLLWAVALGKMLGVYGVYDEYHSGREGSLF